MSEKVKERLMQYRYKDREVKRSITKTRESGRIIFKKEERRMKE